MRPTGSHCFRAGKSHKEAVKRKSKQPVSIKNDFSDR
jgi:hypothetical protein